MMTNTSHNVQIDGNAIDHDELMRTFRRFIADAAHELRTPIAALSLQIDNIISYSDDSMRQERQAALATSIRRLQRLVNQLLDLARAQSTGERDEAVVSINDQTRTQIGELYPLIDEKEINLTVSRNEPVTALDNDHQLQHLIRNALSNAIKFSPSIARTDKPVVRAPDLGLRFAMRSLQASVGDSH